MSISKKPYFVRAFYQWCQDSGLTPYLQVCVDQRTKVPMQYVRDDEIILNIGTGAVHNLTLDNDWIHFSARFSGVSQDVWVPVGNVLSIYARETGEGIPFELELPEPELVSAAPVSEDATDLDEATSESAQVQSSADSESGSFLKIIK